MKIFILLLNLLLIFPVYAQHMTTSDSGRNQADSPINTQNNISKKEVKSSSKKYRHSLTIALSPEGGKDNISFYTGPILKIQYMHSSKFGMEYSIGQYFNFIYDDEPGVELERKMFHLGVKALWFPYGAFNKDMNWYLKTGVSINPMGIKEYHYTIENGVRIEGETEDYQLNPVLLMAGTGIKWNNGWYGWFVEALGQIPLFQIDFFSTSDTTKYKPSWGVTFSTGIFIQF